MAELSTAWMTCNVAELSNWITFNLAELYAG